MHDDRSKGKLGGGGLERKPYEEERWWMNSNISPELLVLYSKSNSMSRNILQYKLQNNITPY
jgi:hypothetical protein